MKRFLSAGFPVIAGLLALGASSAEAQSTKYGFINSTQIVAQAPGAAEARQSLEAEMQGYRVELDRLEAELDSLQTNLERQGTSLSATARQQRQTELQTKFGAYQQRAAELQQTAQRREQELVAPIMQRVSGVIESVRVEGGYGLIFDTAAQGVIVAADPALDLTSVVLQKLGAPPAPAAN